MNEYEYAHQCMCVFTYADHTYRIHKFCYICWNYVVAFTPINGWAARSQMLPGHCIYVKLGTYCFCLFVNTHKEKANDITLQQQQRTQCNAELRALICVKIDTLAYSCYKLLKIYFFDNFFFFKEHSYAP